MPTRPARVVREACLLGVSGRTRGRRVVLGGILEIGSDEQCDLFVDDVGVSRHHTRIAWTGEQATIEDLDSTNGTLVNGERIAAPTVLRHDDHVQVGVATFRFQTFDDASAAMYDELYSLATSDPLTGLFNRHHLRAELERDVDRALRSAGPLSVLMIDVDHFKHFNDTWGHAAGDTALVVVTQRMQSSVRTSDIVGRWGGEEFIVVLPNTSAAVAAHVAERIRARVSADPVRLEAAEAPIAVSIGVADVAVVPHEQRPHGTSRDEVARLIDVLVDAADQQLYRAKSEGRNRVCVAGR